IIRGAIAIVVSFASLVVQASGVLRVAEHPAGGNHLSSAALVANSQTSLVQLRYGKEFAAASDAQDALASNKRSPVMRITFARGGGFAAPLRPKVSGIINLGDNGSEVSSNSTYRRTLAPEEVEQIRAGADPSELTRAERQVAANTSGAGDLD